MQEHLLKVRTKWFGDEGRGGSAKTLNETSEFEERRDKNVLTEMHIDRTLVALLRRV